MRIKYIFTIILFCIRVCLNAQDIHFTQFTQSPLFTNPAMTGNFDGDFRLVGNFKNQWGNIPVPYNTVAGSFDANIASNIFGLGSLGLGVLLNNDDAGDSRLTTRSIQACMAYNKIVGKRKKSIFSFGFNIGYVFKGINTEKLRWDEQFNGDYFDPSIPMTEQLNRMTIHSIDMGAGVNYVNHYAKIPFTVLASRFNISIALINLFLRW
ncbi:MAG: PorP/SprF family type IX secretion system membrane protein [Bacteroidetes bacterium]|nr:PorP/SprF family type IX secretion system membrane protein [Bacteroidota bacterium]